RLLTSPWLLAGLLAGPVPGSGQERAGQPADLEAQFREARSLALAGKYPEARLLLNRIVGQQPAHSDAVILTGRTYAWEGKFADARAQLQPVLAVDPANQDALNALIDTELWDGNPDQAIRHADAGLGYYPNSEDFLLKKAKALLAQQKDEAAAVELNRLLTVNPANQEALQLLQTLRNTALRNFAGLRHYLTLFDNGTRPWHLASAEYGRIIRRVTLIGRLNYARRPDESSSQQSGYQAEVDAYPILGKGTYAYLNAGYSEALRLFPETRFGAELFQKLPKGFEVSAGGRRLNFPDLRITLYTASLSKYYRDYLFVVRGYGSFQSGHFTPTVLFSVRKYFHGPDDFATLTVNNGTVPGVFILASSQQLQQLNSSRVALDFQKGLGKSVYLLGGAWYEYEEYFKTLYRNRYTLTLGVQKRF
ncbi:MAG: YaiO family outer membrane beta-barrel protein, partial [Ferruginibacter sp.]|nr:YaiO family outer membrane beta-barrel protein [Cytophagales bacterium]